MKGGWISGWFREMILQIHSSCRWVVLDFHREHKTILNPSPCCFKEQGAQSWGQVICSWHCWCVQEQFSFSICISICVCPSQALGSTFSSGLIVLFLGALLELLLTAVQRSLTNASGFGKPSEVFCSFAALLGGVQSTPQWPFQASPAVLLLPKPGWRVSTAQELPCMAHTQILLNRRPARFTFKSA